MYPDTPENSADVVELSRVVSAAENELRCLLGPMIGMTTGRLPASGPAPVRARVEDIVDLLRHLALDARDAMAAGGVVTIHSGRLSDVAECAAIVIHEEPGPGQTSLATGIRKGRSLGLGASYDMVKRAGGHFHVSCRGRDTVLTICFPLAG